MSTCARAESERRRRALAARSNVAVSVAHDARWFEAFLRAVLPRAMQARLAWDNTPGPHSDLLVETPLRAIDHTQFVRDDCVRMLISGEPYSVADLTDYDVIVDTKTDPSLRPSDTPFVYVPFYVTSFFERRAHAPADLLGPRGPDPWPRRFAAFMYDQCLPHREEFFDELSRYKAVDALGKCRYSVDADGRCRDRPTNRDLYTDERTYLDDAVDRYAGYRFVVALESASLAGYVTEKLINPMLAGAVPIYWGAPDVNEHFDERSFVNAASFPTAGECVEFVARVDQDDAYYRSIADRPHLHDDRLNDHLDLSATISELRGLLAPPRRWLPRLPGRRGDAS